MYISFNYAIFLAFMAQLSVEGSVNRCILTVIDGQIKYISARKFVQRVIHLVPNCTRDSFWKVEDKDGEVRMKWLQDDSIFNRGSRVSVRVGDYNEWTQLQSPSMKDDGSWSLDVHHRDWLSVDRDGELQTTNIKSRAEHFNFAPITPESGPSHSTSSTTYVASFNFTKKGPIAPLGTGCLRSRNGKYIRIYKTDQWQILLKSFREQRFLRAYKNGRIDLAAVEEKGTKWKPEEQKDGSWQLESQHDFWLSTSQVGFLSQELTADPQAKLKGDFWIISTPLDHTSSEPSTFSKISELSPLASLMHSSQFWLAEKASGPCYLKTSRDYRAIHDFQKKFNRTHIPNPCVVDNATHCYRDEKWFIENRNGKVLIKSVTHSTYLRAHKNGTVDLADGAVSGLTWNAFKHRDDESWSFLSEHNQLLSYSIEYDFLTTDNSMEHARFWLDRIYTKPETCDEINGVESFAQKIRTMSIFFLLCIILVIAITCVCKTFCKQRLEEKKLGEHLSRSLPSLLIDDYEQLESGDQIG